MRSILVVSDGEGPTTLIRGRQFADLFEHHGIRFEFFARRPSWLSKLTSWANARWWSNILYRILVRLEGRVIRGREDL